jgi:hypothetical protein
MGGSLPTQEPGPPPYVLYQSNMKLILAWKEELAVHKRKVQDVRQWLLESFKGGITGSLRRQRVSLRHLLQCQQLSLAAHSGSQWARRHREDCYYPGSQQRARVRYNGMED